MFRIREFIILKIIFWSRDQLQKKRVRVWKTKPLIKIWSTNRFLKAKSYNFHIHKNDVTWPLSANGLLLLFSQSRQWSLSQTLSWRPTIRNRANIRSYKSDYKRYFRRLLHLLIFSCKYRGMYWGMFLSFLFFCQYVIVCVWVCVRCIDD